ncbi:MAG TPA: 2OG-Fe(II) oxygenase family protein [Gammaproteobacteria bacterium]|nr:2OG-Fe(II) oxygenase family protein [Gammaproteobacteria bacterium]
MSTETLPVIDVGDLRRAATQRAIDVACRDWGFFQIVGHGIAERTLDALRRQMRAFFALPLSAKHALMRTAENPWGFYDRELTKHTRDWKQVYDYGPADGGAIVPQLPRELPRFASAIARFYAECDALAFELVEVIAGNLGTPPGALDSCFRPDHTSFLRLNYYPPCPMPARPADVSTAGGREVLSATAPCVALPRASLPAPAFAALPPSMAGAGHLGVNPHTDAGALTLLLQDDEPGLEVFHDGAWRLVEPRRDALVVNIGDIVQVWSNDRYTAALHRALVSSNAERFSAPFFFNPAYRTWYAPLVSTLDAEHPPRYRPIHWGEFRARRAAGDYADHGEYHSIHHYSR